MLRTLLFVLFSLIHLGCVRVVDSQQGTKQVTRPQIASITAGSTTVSDDDYLLDLTLTSSTTTEETETTMNDLSNDYEESNNSCDINNFQSSSYSNKINVSWDDCDSNYNVQITKTVYDSLEIPQFRRLNHTSWYQFKKLEECTAYNISIETDYEFLYRTTIRTLPGKVQNLQMIREDHTLNFNWSMPVSKDCRTRVTVDEQHPRDISVNRYEVPYNLTRCTTVEITLVDNYNNMGEITTRAVPGLVQDLIVTFESDTIYVTWNKPLDESCVVGYKIALNGETVDDIITETEYTFSNLKPCTQYVVGVAATSNTDDDGEFYEETGTTETPDSIAAVENLRSVSVDNTLQVTWNPPALHDVCITGYGIAMWGLSTGTQNHETQDTSFEFSPVVGCATYNIMVVAKIQQREGVPNTVSPTISAIVTDPPTLSSVDTDKISSTVHLRLQSYATNECSITSIIINCTALSTENQPYDWIVSEASKQQTHTDSSIRTATVDIENLSPFTNYTCYAYAENSAGISGASDAIKFTTAQEVPSAPQNLTHEEDDDGILISWEPPEVIPGILRNYKVTMTPIAALHYIPENCSISVSVIEEETTELQLQINGSLPSFEYNITVSASTDAGFGKEEILTIETNSKASEAPRNVEMELSSKEEETNNVVLQVSWVPPCNSNGRLAHFQWELDGISVVDNDVHNVIGTVTVKSENDTLYEAEISVKPFFNYTFTLAAYSGEEDNETRGEEYFDTFISPEGTSGAPEGLQVENITATGAVIIWEEPTNKNGEILSYRIEITTTGPNHYIPNYCNLYYEPSYSGNTDPNTFLYVFDKGQPNFHYKISIFATTSAGNGSERTLEFDTESDVPELPLNVTVEIHNHLGETYDASAIFNWLLPCNTNGPLNSFMWTLEGVSLNNGEYVNNSGTKNFNINKKLAIYELTLRDLEPLFNYTFTLTVCNMALCGDNEVLNFFTPDGYASPPTNLTVENMTSYSGVLVWEEPVNKNGKIQTYEVEITSDGPAHYIPNNCKIDKSPAYNASLNYTVFSFPFEGLPNYKRIASVVALTRVGGGYAAFISFVQNPSPSEEPRELGYTPENILGEIYNFTATITWLLPCNTNGNLTGFSWNLEGTSLEDSSVYNISERIEPNNDITDVNYQVIIRDLRPIYRYEFSIAAVVGDEKEIIGVESNVTFDSPDGIPTKPYNIVCTWGSYFAYVNWSEPVRKNGILQNYRLVITTSGPTYTLPDFCSLNFNTVVYNTTVDPELIGYSMGANPNFLYTVTVAAATRTGYGPENEISFATMGTDPQQLNNIEYEIMTNQTETYSSYVSISFDRPCELYGSFIHYSVEISGERNGIVKDHQLTLDNHASNRFRLDLDPSFTYTGHIAVYTMSGSSITAITKFTAPAGVPPISNAELEAPILTPTTAALVLSDDLFNDSQGDIIYYAVIVNVGVDVSEGLGGSFDFWERSSWPTSGIWSSTEDKIEYQATPEFWNPFETTRTVNVTYILGDANCSSTPSTYCNGPLRPSTQYAVRIRGFTTNGYRDTSVVHFITPSVETYLALILGLVFGLLAAAVLLFFVLLLWRKKKKSKETKEEEVTGIHAAKPPPIPKNKFAEHCLMFEEDRSQLKAEYSHLERLSASEKSSSNVAMADNNKRKNRYINIMPFDDTRVKLTMDNNDNYDDYINASYIKGYSGNHEYIATQGPMGTTLEDFWRMIVQEDVGIIVMVAQFVEQSKQKCFKYFPEKEEIMNVGCDINVKCTTEANLNDYYTRTLIVEKNGQQKTIKHLQYMLWPDFGCPTNTNSMLEFREIMRKHIENTKNKAIIHCSAGVGRTGTLIAIDILLQKIDNSNDDIDVFGTVLDLRRQRTHMVQTEKQYEYIHKCLRDYLTKPRPISDDHLNPIYENVSIINGYANIPGIAGGHPSTENLIKLKEL